MLFLILFLSLRLFPSIITCPRDWVTVVQSAGKRRLFNICWEARRESIDYWILFPTLHAAWLLGPLCLQSHIHHFFPRALLATSAQAIPDPQRPVVELVLLPFFFFKRFEPNPSLVARYSILSLPCFKLLPRTFPSGNNWSCFFLSSLLHLPFTPTLFKLKTDAFIKRCRVYSEGEKKWKMSPSWKRNRCTAGRSRKGVKRLLGFSEQRASFMMIIIRFLSESGPEWFNLTSRA